MEIMLIIMTIGFLLSVLVGYWAVLKLLNERNNDRERMTKALQNQYLQFKQAKQTLIEEREAANTLGKQEGKRLVLDWIRQNVDDGTMTVSINKQ